MKELFEMLNGLSNRKLNKRSFLAACGAAAAAAAISAPSAGAASANERRIAVIYFSKTGHTQSLAECVSDMTGAKLFRVETVDPYPEEYRETTEIVKAEIENNIARPIKPLQVNLDEFDVVILMTPTWWHHVARPLQTWMESAKLADRTNLLILTANTHGGGGRMHTREDFEKWLPQSRLGTHFTVFGGVPRGSALARRKQSALSAKTLGESSKLPHSTQSPLLILRSPTSTNWKSPNSSANGCTPNI